MNARLLGAGGNTNPWAVKTYSDRLVRPRDLVAFDTDMSGPVGYYADISRTYLWRGRQTQQRATGDI